MEVLADGHQKNIYYIGLRLDRNGTVAALGKAVESRTYWPGKGHEFSAALGLLWSRTHDACRPSLALNCSAICVGHRALAVCALAIGAKLAEAGGRLDGVGLLQSSRKARFLKLCEALKFPRAWPERALKTHDNPRG